jgi:hypothetical protein
MSFHVSFVARNAYEARAKLAQAQAPGAVKAVIEMAIAGAQLPPAGPAASVTISSRSAADAGVAQAGGTRPPSLLGIMVEAWGHVAEAGEGAMSHFQRFEVRPLID